MKPVFKTKPLFIASALVSLILTLSACGGGGSSGSTPSVTPASSAPASSSPSSSSSSVVSSSSSSVVVSKNYTVSVNVPASFLGADSTNSETNVALTASNLALVSVSLSGVVVERYNIKSSDITKKEDGNWNIKAAVDPRLDTVIVADVGGAEGVKKKLSNPSLATVTQQKITDLTVIDNINQDGLVFAPLTSDTVDIDIGSTSAYKNFIQELGGSGTFQSQGIDPKSVAQIAAVENLVNNVQEKLADQDFTGKTSVLAALTAVQDWIKTIVAQEALNVKTPATGNMVTLFRDEGGLHWFDTDTYDATGKEAIIHGALVGLALETREHYNGTGFVATAPFDNGDSDIVLSSTGWVETNELSKGSSYNADGSVTMTDGLADGDKSTLVTTQVIDLAGRKIVDFFLTQAYSSALAGVVNPTATFGAGAKAYRGNIVAPVDIYTLSNDEGSTGTGLCPFKGSKTAADYGGNCDVLETWGADIVNALSYDGVHTTLNSIFSADVQPSASNFKGVGVNFAGNGHVAAQFINYDAKTVRYYKRTWTGSSVLIATSTWSYVTLPNLATDATAIKIELPQAALNAGDFNEDQHTFIVVKHAGFLRMGWIAKAGDVQESNFTVLNGFANTSITAGLKNYTNPLVGKWGDVKSDVFTFTNNTFVHSKTSSPDSDPNCKTGMSMGTYTWNPITFVMTNNIESDTTAVDPSDSCSIDTGMKWQPVDGGLKVTYVDHGVEVTFIAPKIAP